MLENKIKQIKKINPKKIIYPAVLIVYFGMIALFLFFSLKFFTKELNLILSADELSQNGQNRPVLDAAGYSLLEKKFKLTPYTAPQTPVISEPEIAASSTSSGTPAPDIISSGTPPFVATSAEPQSESASTAPLTISILNSTKTSGLAGKLKKEFEAAAIPITKVGNSSPVLATTTVNLSPDKVNHPDLSAIKSVLAENGLSYIENLLPEAGEYDLEIIIGLPR